MAKINFFTKCSFWKLHASSRKTDNAMDEVNFFAFDYEDRRFSCDGIPLLDLGAPTEHYWSLSAADSLTSLANELAKRMDKVQNQISKKLSNEALLKNTNRELFLHPISQPVKTEQEHIYFANIIHYQALHLFFSNLDKEAYSFAHFLATWQWYWLSHLLVKLEDQDDTFLNNQMLSENFRLAYNALLGLINDPVYRTIMGKQSICVFLRQNTLTVNEIYHLAIHLNFDLDLEKKQWITQIITGPDTREFEKDFDKVNFHPKFRKYPTAVVRLISDHFLPSYNFQGAIKIAALLQDTRTDEDNEGKRSDFLSAFNWIPSKFFHNVPLAIASLIALLLAVTMAGTWLFNYCETWPLDHNLKALLISSGELAVLFFGVGLPVFSKFRNLLVHLLLPRLVAGIAVGYLAFVLQDQTYRIPNYFFENKPLWYQILSIIILFTICFGFGYFYLYADITQFTVGKKKPVPKRRSLTTRLVRRRGRSSGGSQNETRNRVLTTWLVALLISFGIGMFACVFMTDLTKPAYFGNYLGPFGWFNLGLLSFYMPISIVVGLISQFIFEEKSLTAPTWNAESML